MKSYVADEAADVYTVETTATFDVVLVAADVAHKQLIGVELGGGVAFALLAVAGNEFFGLDFGVLHSCGSVDSTLDPNFTRWTCTLVGLLYR